MEPCLQLRKFFLEQGSKSGQLDLISRPALNPLSYRGYPSYLNKPNLTLLYSEQPKLYGVLAVLSAVGLR